MFDVTRDISSENLTNPQNTANENISTTSKCFLGVTFVAILFSYGLVIWRFKRIQEITAILCLPSAMGIIGLLSTRSSEKITPVVRVGVCLLFISTLNFAFFLIGNHSLRIYYTLPIKYLLLPSILIIVLFLILVVLTLLRII